MLFRSACRRDFAYAEYDELGPPNFEFVDSAVIVCDVEVMDEAALPETCAMILYSAVATGKGRFWIYLQGPIERYFRAAAKSISCLSLRLYQNLLYGHVHSYILCLCLEGY